ncbi:MAG: ABC transporter permease [Acidimicrobiales bacterium]
MARIFLRRLVMSLLLILIVPSLTFFFEALTPGNIAEEILGPTATLPQIHRLDAQFGLNRPLYLQYWHWLDGLFHGTLGSSFQTGESVTSMLSPRLPVTVSLVFGSVIFALIVGLALGIVSANRRGALPKLVDVGSVVGLALPGYWLATVLILLLAVRFRVFPAVGYVAPTASPVQWLRSIVLPSVALGLGLATFVAKQTRDRLLAALSGDYVRTLRANGASGSSILFKHALRNAGIPVVTVLGLAFVGALSGSVFVEQVFSLPGLGSALVVAAQYHDLPVVEAISLYFTVIVVLVNLFVDFAYVALDPRVRSAA